MDKLIELINNNASWIYTDESRKELTPAGAFVFMCSLIMLFDKKTRK